MNTNSHVTLKNEDIILISNQMMEDRYWTSKQYITQELVKSNKVLYVEANYSFGKLFLGLVRGTWPVHPFGALHKQHDNLWVLTPFPRLPLRNHIRFMGWLNQMLLRVKIRGAVKRIGLDQTILWTFLHQTSDLIGKLGEKLAVYHCVDDWPALLAMAGMGKPERIMQDENELLHRVDLVFRVSTKLLAGREPQGTKVLDIPNGVDTSLFRLSDDTEKLAIDDLDPLPTPIIGFSGSIGAWIDVDLIQKVAEHYYHCSIVLIGLNEKNPRLNDLLKTSNVHFLGMKKREEVPQYLSRFNVCLMPFDKGQIGEGLLPLKMFEYLALGRPIVTITSKAMDTFKDVLYCAEDAPSFIQKVETALSEGEQVDKVRERIQKAEEYSWANRVHLYGENINRMTVQGDIHAE